MADRRQLTLLIFCTFVAACSSSPPASREVQREGESLNQAVERVVAAGLGDDFGKAIEDHLHGPARGVAILSSHDNLYLVAADLGDRTQRMFASVYVQDDHTYWKVEDLNASNRELLVLLRDAGAKETDATDYQVEQ